MHSPVLAPVHGMPSTCGRSGLPGIAAGVLATSPPTQEPLVGSRTIPAGHSATWVGVLEVGTTTATAGAAATARANPPRRIVRRDGMGKVIVVTPFWSTASFELTLYRQLRFTQTQVTVDTAWPGGCQNVSLTE